MSDRGGVLSPTKQGSTFNVPSTSHTKSVSFFGSVNDDKNATRLSREKKEKKGDWDKSSDFIRACSGGDRQIKVNYLGDMKDTELAHDLVGPLSTRAECLALYKISSQIYRAK